jgi:predicted NAD/FAD-dependent oxidoreductase
VIAHWKARLVAFDVDGQRPAGRDQDRYVGVPGMSAVAEHLARDVEPRCRVKVDRLVRQGKEWRAVDAEGQTLAEAEAVIVAVPPAQVLPLLTMAPGLAEAVRPVTMLPCWAVMLGFGGELPVDFDGAFVNEGALAWVARNSSKPGREGGEAWILHASPEWSERNLETEAEEVLAVLSAEFANRCVGAELPAPAHAVAHRWRYAQPQTALEAPCLFDDELRIGVAGDWCGGPRIEGAFLSGAALAGRILGRAGDWSGGAGAGP